MGPARRLAELTVVASAVLGLIAAAPARSAEAQGGPGARQVLQFGVASDFTLQPFQGATLSYERRMGHSIALRVGVGISLRTEATDQGFDFSGTTENHAENDLTNSRHVYTADCQLLWYKGDRLSWYWGAGPRVAYSGFRRESGDFRVVGDEVQTVSERYEFEQWGAGLAAILGLRFQLNDTFSLDAQYGSALMFVHSTVSARQAFSDAVSTSRRTSDDTDTVEVKPDAVRLAVSAFF